MSKLDIPERFVTTTQKTIVSRGLMSMEIYHMHLTLKEGYLKNAHWHLTHFFIVKETLNATIKKDHQERRLQGMGPKSKNEQLIAQDVNDTNLI
jgi:hypothetical protein